MKQYDLVVIGSGPAGQKGAIAAAKKCKKVAVVERSPQMGGAATLTGTIPSKSLREAVLYLTGYGQKGFYGASYRVKEKITPQDLSVRVRFVIQRETEVVRSQLLRNGVDLYEGAASFVDPHTIAVAAPGSAVETLGGDFVLVAVGTVPAIPKGIECDGKKRITSDQLLTLGEIPKSIVIVGAGVIGVEYASIFAHLGLKVTLVDKRTKMLDFLDTEIAEALSYSMREAGVVLRLGEEVASLGVDDGPAGQGVAVLVSGKQIRSDMILFSAGRVGSIDGLALDKAGLQGDDRGRLVVDEHFRTKVPHIFAAGDVIGFPALASTSMEQGRIAVCNAFGFETKAMNAVFPYGIYAIPEVSYVGKNEQELTAEKVPYEIGVSHYKEIARGQILGDDEGRLKLIFHRETRRLLGAHVLGSGATELIHIGQAVLSLGGTLDYFVNAVFNYPTLAECYKVAALDAMNRLSS